MSLPQIGIILIIGLLALMVYLIMQLRKIDYVTVAEKPDMRKSLSAFDYNEVIDDFRRKWFVRDESSLVTFLKEEYKEIKDYDVIFLCDILFPNDEMSHHRVLRYFRS